MLQCIAISAISLNVSCVSKRDSTGSDPLSTENQTQKRTACLSFQGNGTYFSSHIGALIALLERNFEPVFVTGGSSGAIIASIARALVDNPTLAAQGAFAPPQAARLLAASGGVIESVLFLPRFTTPLMLMDSFDVFVSGTSQGILYGEPKDGMVNAESIVGQSALVIDFFRNANFSEALQQKTIQDREAAVSKLWQSYSNSILVTPADAADAILTDKSTLASQGRQDLIAVQDRLFKMFRSKLDTASSNYRTQQAEWNTFVAANAQTFGLTDTTKRRAVFNGFLGKVKLIQSFDALYASFSADFLLMDPDLVWGAFAGYAPNGKPMELPSNVILHSTARRSQKTAEGFREQRGFTNLHQVYFANQNLVERARRTILEPASNPLKPPAAGADAPISSDRIVVTKSLLGPALAASTGEPSAFTRYEIKLDDEARKRLPWLGEDDFLMGYGGWLESNSLGTGRQFSECSPHHVDMFMASGDGLDLNSFAKMAYFGLLLDQPLRGALARQTDNPNDLRAFLEGRARQIPLNLAGPEVEGIEKAASAIKQVFAASKSMQGRLGSVAMEFDHASPSQSTGQQAEQANIAFRSNRRALVLGSYEYTRDLLSKTEIPQQSSKTAIFGIPSSSISVLSASSGEAVASIVNEAMPRP
jgi:hypothetical protein